MGQQSGEQVTTMSDAISPTLTQWVTTIMRSYDEGHYTEHTTAVLLVNAIYRAAGIPPTMEDIVTHTGLSASIAVQARRKAIDLWLLDYTGAFRNPRMKGPADSVALAAVEEGRVLELAWQLQNATPPEEG